MRLCRLTMCFLFYIIHHHSASLLKLIFFFLTRIRPDSPTSIINPECDPVTSSEVFDSLWLVSQGAWKLQNLLVYTLFAAGSGRHQSPRCYQCIIVYQSIQSLMLETSQTSWPQRLPLCDRLRMMQRRFAGTGHSLSVCLFYDCLLGLDADVRYLSPALRNLHSRSKMIL